MGVKSAGIGIVAFIYCVIDTIWEFFCLVSSPIWFPVLLIANPLRAAQELNAKSIREWNVSPTWADWYLTNIHNLLIYYLMRWLWTPLIVLLPMKRYRSEFIREGEKRLNEYSAKTQVAYYNSCCDGGKQSLLMSGALSPEVRERIFKNPFEWKNWIESGLELSREQVETLLKNGQQTLLRLYFKKSTPNKDMINLLLDYAQRNSSTAQYVMLQLIRQQRPNSELIGKMLSTGNSSFIKEVSKVIDGYADLDAVNFGVKDVKETSLPEEKERIFVERWTNFCRHKKEISVAAQKKMGYDQYLIYVQTGHKLDYQALLHMCLHVQNKEFLEDILSIEFEKVDEALQTALKSEYWRYSLYLKVKEVCSGKA